ncbi:hypothetical protein L228DRAFT_250392 [Xylona heveae TC161]|uniref:Uncharacterized protein n=1 Tax=Xylona heveae (strain CBS 132557 / TC161) TaxID=1328760 RepID=A0A165A5E2_XYLHT|nr:hypothetical protein L228DRAFT_250392 [Xylona heveae TC161]KZF19975.1 hypothetical protein L228DRAFT_250392 [Xylona heveae TC161]
MASHQINILLSSFPGLGLPPTLSLQLSPTASISDLTSQIWERLPAIHSRLILTSNENKQILPSSLSVSSLLTNGDDFLPLRLSVPLCGGKGGFGSQLRAAGGRMSSRRKKNQGEDNGSNRNLDGRRLRTVNEAKALAEYLALKPDMEKKEKDERRKRWEEVVALAERREHEIKSSSKGKVDGQWVEDKEEAGERTREAVLAAMKDGHYRDNILSTSADTSSSSNSKGASDESEDDAGPSSSTATSPPSSVDVAPGRTFFGFDEDDEFMSDEEEEEIEDENMDADDLNDIKGKGKAAA